MKNFAIIGAAGYIAPRHMKAIEDTGNRLVSAFDPVDSVGIIDRFARDAAFFKSSEELLYHLDKKGISIDYTSICSPNYLHASHINLAYSYKSHVICEKPLVISMDDLYHLKELEERSSCRIFTVLQLREHQKIKNLKANFEDYQGEQVNVDLCYITSRGPWYSQTWKANKNLSGSLCFNIGIHFFDMLTWIFGSPLKTELHVSRDDVMSGYLELEKAKVRWFLSTNEKYLPAQSKQLKSPTFRSIKLNNEEIEFSSGFTDLHTEVYKKILVGKGFGVSDAEPAIEVAEKMNNATPTGTSSYSHPLVNEL